MAAPVADAYSALSGADVFAGRFSGGRLAGGASLGDTLAAGGLGTHDSGVSGNATLGDLSASGSVDGFFIPAWRAAMAPYTWRAIPTVNKMSDLDPRYNPAMNPVHPSPPEWNGNGQASMMNAWCGACYDLDTDDFWIPLGGGHSDYGGNEPYKLNLYSDTPTWVMLRPPSGALGNILTTDDGQEASGVYSDGRVRATHTYNRCVFVPGVGPCLGTAQSGWTSAATAGAISRFLKVHPTTGETIFGATNPLGPINQSGACSTYDPSRHAVWHMGLAASQMLMYDVAADTWATAGSALYVTGAFQNASIVYIPGDDVIVYRHEYFGAGMRVFDPTTNVYHTPTVTGTLVGGVSMEGLCQGVWVPSLNAIALWDNDTSRDVINIITKPANPRTGTWVISQLAVSGANAVIPSARNARRTFNRFQYSSRLNGFVVINNTNEFPYFFALS